MNDQQQSRADALTDAQRRTLQSALDLFVAMGHSPDSDHVRTLSAMLAAYRVQQPAAAPIDECELCHSSGYMDETLGGALPGVPDAPCMNGCKATEQTAPSPADERAALAKLRAEMFDWLASCTKEHIDGKIEFINRVTEGFAAIYARAVASPAASVPAGWKLVPVAPTPEMCCAMEEAIDAGWKDSIVWARGIAAAPQPPAQADTIQCQAHSGPDCTECGGTGIWPSQADAPADTACPHAGVHRYCMSCPVSPCPIGLGEKK